VAMAELVRVQSHESKSHDFGYDKISHYFAINQLGNRGKDCRADTRGSWKNRRQERQFLRYSP